jgi:serine/threonine protein kinase
MNLRAGDHPVKDVLLSFYHGTLPDEEARAVLAHLEICVDCCEGYGSISVSDPFQDLCRAVLRDDVNLFHSHPRLADTARFLNQESADTLEDAATFLPPAELRDHPQFEILHKLGQGGMGVVYLSRHRLTGRLEVLKVINKARLVSQPEAVDRFEREILSVSQLDHPNIARGYTAFQAADSFVLVMEFVDGPNLGELVKQIGPLPVANACLFAQQAALGLQHAQENGWIHRDIKPENLVATCKDGQETVKILDFGLAKAVREQDGLEPHLTETGTTFGTPHFMAPEQINDSAKADLRSDIYSLGCTLYFLLTGAPPFPGKNAYAVMKAHEEKEAPSPHTLRPEVPPELAAVVQKMMAKGPEERFQTPREVLDALTPFAQNATAILTRWKEGLEGAPAPVRYREKVTQRRGALNRPTLVAREERKATPFRAALITTTAIVLLALVFLAASQLIRVRTPNGILVIEVNEANPDVFVDGEKVTVTWANGGKQAEIQVKPGTREVQVKKDGFSAFGRQVELEEGGRTVLTAKLMRAAETVKPAPIPETGWVRLFNGKDLTYL